MKTTCDPISTDRPALVRWAARIGCVTDEALAEREQITLASARGRLLAAERLGLLARTRPLAAKPSIYTLTRAGLRASGLVGLRPARVSPSSAMHAIACAQVAARLERAYPRHLLVGEPELRREERDPRGRGCVSAELPPAGGSPRLHRPDMALWPAPGARRLPVAIEVELTVKAPLRLAEICTAWARCSRVAGVLYIATPEVSRALDRAIERARAQTRIAVLGLELCELRSVPGRETREPSQAVRTVAGGGSTSQRNGDQQCRSR